MILLLIGAGVYFLGANKTENNSTEEKNINVEKFGQYDSIFKSVGAKYGVPWLRLKRIAWIESKVGTYKSVALGIKNPNDVKSSVSQDGKSWGIMQMTLTTMGDYDKTPTPQELNDVKYSIDLAGQHLKMLGKLFVNERDIVMSYNHGQGNQKNFVIKEKAGTLLKTEYLAGRDYWAKYQQAIAEVG